MVKKKKGNISTRYRFNKGVKSGRTKLGGKFADKYQFVDKTTPERYNTKTGKTVRRK